MSMMCYLLQLSPAQFAILGAAPAAVAELAMAAQTAGTEQQLMTALAMLPVAEREARGATIRAALANLPGRATGQDGIVARLEASGPLSAALGLQKSWHILHYLMTGDAIPTDSPASALLLGEDIGDDFAGYGPARWISPAETAAFAAALGHMNLAALQSRLDLEAMAAIGIYALPMGGSPDRHARELRDEVAVYFPRLQAYAAEAARTGNGLLTWLS
jgi:hypothetical protein